jgi:hypothetical protein
MLLPTHCPNGSIDLGQADDSGVFIDVADDPPEVRAQRACVWGVNAKLTRGSSQIKATEGDVTVPAICPEDMNPTAPPYIIEEHATKNFTPYTFCAASVASVTSADDAEPASCPAGQLGLGVLRDRRPAGVRSYRLCVKDAKLGVVKNTIDEVINHLGTFYGCKASGPVLALTPGGSQLVQDKSACATLSNIFPPVGGRKVHAACRPDGIWDQTNESDPITDEPLSLVPSSIKWDPAVPFPAAKSREGCCPADKCWNGNGCTDSGDIYVVGTRAFLCQ